MFELSEPEGPKAPKKDSKSSSCSSSHRLHLVSTIDRSNQDDPRPESPPPESDEPPKQELPESSQLTVYTRHRPLDLETWILDAFAPMERRCLESEIRSSGAPKTAFKPDLGPSSCQTRRPSTVESSKDLCDTASFKDLRIQASFARSPSPREVRESFGGEHLALPRTSRRTDQPEERAVRTPQLGERKTGHHLDHGSEKPPSFSHPDL